MFTTEIVLKGKHATYLDFLCKPQDGSDKTNRACVFETVYDAFTTAIVIGLRYGLKVEEDKLSSDTKKIFADKVIRESLNLVFLYQLVMLIDNKNMTNEEKIARAFRKAENKEDMEIFMSYARGGIEWLFNKFTIASTTKDDYLNDIHSIVTEYQEEIDVVKAII